jgi:hypothetical protein
VNAIPKAPKANALARIACEKKLLLLRKAVFFFFLFYMLFYTKEKRKDVFPFLGRIKNSIKKNSKQVQERIALTTKPQTKNATVEKKSINK